MNLLEEKKSTGKQIVDILVQMAVVASFAWFVVYCFGTYVTNVGNAMQPTILHGDALLINRMVYTFSPPQRYDVVVFKTGDGRELIRRIIGLPGERVQIKAGLIYIDGKPIERLAEATLAGLASEEMTLGENTYFVLGDARNQSEDSRFESIGNINIEDIDGKVWFLMTSVTRWGFIGDENRIIEEGIE